MFILKLTSFNMGLYLTTSRLDDRVEEGSAVSLTLGVKGRDCDPGQEGGDILTCRKQIESMRKTGIIPVVLSLNGENGLQEVAGISPNDPKIQEKRRGETFPGRTALDRFEKGWEGQKQEELTPDQTLERLKDEARQLGDLSTPLLWKGLDVVTNKDDKTLAENLSKMGIEGPPLERLKAVGDAVSAEIMAVLRGEKPWKLSPKADDLTQMMVLSVPKEPRFTTDLMTQGLAWKALETLGENADFSQMAEMVQRDTWSRMLEAYVTRQVIAGINDLPVEEMEKRATSPVGPTDTADQIFGRLMIVRMKKKSPAWIQVATPNKEGTIDLLCDSR